MMDHEEPKDWEIKDEEPPERLQRKWAVEDNASYESALCSSCGKLTPRYNLTCIFCGTVLPQAKKPIKFLLWLKKLFSKSFL